MSIDISPETHQLLEQKLKGSPYGSADEMIRAALDALADREACNLDDSTLDAIDRAEEQIERGELREWKDVRDEIRNRLAGN